MPYLKLNHLQIVDVAKRVTRKEDNDTAVAEFKKKLNSSESYFNPEPIPKNESDKEAHKKCGDIEGAKKYCPKRWAALELWMAESRKVGSSNLLSDIVKSFCKVWEVRKLPRQ